MSASLVGSEMCIRDRSAGGHTAPGRAVLARSKPTDQWHVLAPPRVVARPVSYTHLTLPTICSV
eukprot:13507346-Alexandrium_andersonii.AAC.1